MIMQIFKKQKQLDFERSATCWRGILTSELHGIPARHGARPGPKRVNR